MCYDQKNTKLFFAGCLVVDFRYLSFGLGVVNLVLSVDFPVIVYLSTSMFVGFASDYLAYLHEQAIEGARIAGASIIIGVDLNPNRFE